MRNLSANQCGYRQWSAVRQRDRRAASAALVLGAMLLGGCIEAAGSGAEWQQAVDRGEAAIDEARWEDAIDAYSEAIALQTDDGMSYFFRGWAHREIDQHAAAVDDLTKAIELVEPNSVRATAFQNRALACQAQGDLEQAVADISQSIALEPEEAPWYLLRAELYEGLERPEEAAADRQRAEELQKQAE